MSNLLLSKIGHVISEFPLAFKQTKEVKLFMTLLVKTKKGCWKRIYSSIKRWEWTGLSLLIITPQIQLRTLSVNTNKRVD